MVSLDMLWHFIPLYDYALRFSGKITVKLYVECVLEIWFRYVVDILLVCLRYGLDSLWYVIVSYGIFFVLGYES